MERQHIHFAIGILGDKNVISGMRKDCEILIYLNLQLALSGMIIF
jgi:2'-phosphotransferase